MAARESERGTVTAELAVGLPVVLVVLVAVLTLTAASTAQMRALDAARAGARAVAVGEGPGAVRGALERVGGPGAGVRLPPGGGRVGGTAQMRALDAARAGARAVAVGEGPGAVRAAVERVGGPGAELTLAHEGEWVQVTVTRPVAQGGWAGPLRATGSATAWVEP